MSELRKASGQRSGWAGWAESLCCTTTMSPQDLLHDCRHWSWLVWSALLGVPVFLTRRRGQFWPHQTSADQTRRPPEKARKEKLR